jgi:predicted metal-dependent hydrolase
MKDKLLNIQGVDVTLFSSKRAKRLNITIKPFTGVRVSVPRYVSFKKAKQATLIIIIIIIKHHNNKHETNNTINKPTPQ